MVVPNSDENLNTFDLHSLDQIPQDMRSKRRWINWRIEEGRKVPFRCDDPTIRASSTDPSTWSTFEAAVASAKANGMSGIGYVLDDNNFEITIDLDNCIDEQGIITDWAVEILEQFGTTYAEISPSGLGIKIFCRGELSELAARQKTAAKFSFGGDHHGIEVFRKSRYLCMTGKIVDGSIAQLNHCQDALDWLWAKYFTPKPKPAKQQPESHAVWHTYSDDNRLERARRYIASMPPAISGQGGHDQTYSISCVAYRFGLVDAQAYEVVSEYNSRCQPPWSDHELRHKLDDARKAVDAAGEFGSMLQQAFAQPAIGGATPAPSNKSAPRELLPAPIPDDLYHVPGFIAEVMEYTLETAPYPNKRLAFAGALALLSLLTGRKVIGTTGLSTNIMLMALANSGCGKDHPRKVNSRILTAATMAERLGGRIASGQGLEDAILEQPAMLFQIDEFDSILTAINKPSDAIGAEIAARLMELYSAAQGTYYTRVKAGTTRQSIYHPHLVVFGTCVPSSFYANLTPKLLSNGLVARSLIIEVGKRGEGQTATYLVLPGHIVEQANYWRDLSPSGGNLDAISGVSQLKVTMSPEAEEQFTAARRHADRQHDACHEQQDNVGCAIWARMVEQAHKLALLYACSTNCFDPIIDTHAASWAIEFAKRHTVWLLHQAQDCLEAETRHEKIANRILAKIRKAGGRLMRSDALSASKVNMREYDEVVGTLVDQGAVELVIEGRAQFLILLQQPTR